MNEAGSELAFDPDPPVDVARTGRDDLAELGCARAGDERAFTALYRRHSDAVYRYAWLLTGSESAAADAMQEAFIELIEGDGFDPDRGSIAAYLCGIARHRAFRAIDRRLVPVERIDDLLDSEPDMQPLPQDALERGRALERLYAAIRTLPAPFREVLILVELQELPYAEAAAIAGIEIGTVRSRLSRAKARLAAILCEQEVS
jgi:RNA polymerase sigma-70 factor (ECF subfamily)